MRAKPELYRIFRVVAEKESISLASQVLFISQSAVSQSIKLLESALGLSLFRRTPKGVTLTNEGKLLYEYARPAIDLLEAAEEKLFAVKDLSKGELKIGASDTLTKHLLLPRLEEFSKSYPEIKLRIVNRTTLEAVELLKSGRLDIAFVNLPLTNSELRVESVFPVQDVFVAAPGYCKDRTYFLREIAAMPLILLEDKSNSRRFIDSVFKEGGITVSPEIELGSHELLLELARIRLGVSCVTREFSKSYLDSGALVELRLSPPLPARAIGTAQLKGVSLSPAALKFMELY